MYYPCAYTSSSGSKSIFYVLKCLFKIVLTFTRSLKLSGYYAKTSLIYFATFSNSVHNYDSGEMFIVT